MRRKRATTSSTIDGKTVAQLFDRANHIGVQPMNTVDGLENAVMSGKVFIQETQPTLVSGQPFVWYEIDESGVIQDIHIFDGVI